MGPYALIVNGAIGLVAPLPAHLVNESVAVQEAAGWFLIDVLTNPRPVDTATTTWSSGFVMVDGRPVEQWTEVAKSAKQIEEEGRSNKAFALTTARKAAYARLNQIANYVPPPITSNAIAQVELAKTMAAVQDMAVYMKELARLLLRGDMLDPDKD